MIYWLPEVIELGIGWACLIGLELVVGFWLSVFFYF